jgi:hypothetical protein
MPTVYGTANSPTLSIMPLMSLRSSCFSCGPSGLAPRLPSFSPRANFRPKRTTAVEDVDKEEHVTAIVKRMNAHARGHADHSRGRSDDPFKVVSDVVSMFGLRKLESQPAARHGRLCSILCEPAHSACIQEMSSMNKRSGLIIITLMIHDDTTSKLSLSDLRASLGTGPALQCYFIIRGPTVRDLPDEFIHREGPPHAGNHLLFPLSPSHVVHSGAVGTCCF